MKHSEVLFLLLLAILLFRKSSGTAGVISLAITIVGLAGVGAFLLVNGY